MVADETLLEQFVRNRDEAAFTALVQRFGPLVLGVCRRVLRHEQDAEDAFQAAFFVLARKAGSIRRRESVASWLYAVAFRMACKVKSKKAQQPVPSPDLPEQPTHDPTPQWAHREVQPVLDEEVHRLPFKYRQAFVLCYLEGKSNEQAARQLGCPTGTILSRLSRAREKLRHQLTRRGIVLSAGALATVLSEQAATALPSAIVRLTSQRALLFAASKLASASLATQGAAVWAEAFLRARMVARWKVALGAGITTGLVTTAIWWLWPGNAPQVVPAAPTNAVLAPAPFDANGIQGAWRVVSMQNGPNMLRDPGFTMEFEGDQFRLLRGDDIVLQHNYAVDPDHDPARINFIRADGRVMPGIYELAGDNLKFCFDFDGRERPTRFETPIGVDFNLFLARRLLSVDRAAPK